MTLQLYDAYKIVTVDQKQRGVDTKMVDKQLQQYEDLKFDFKSNRGIFNVKYMPTDYKQKLYDTHLNKIFAPISNFYSTSSEKNHLIDSNIDTSHIDKIDVSEYEAKIKHMEADKNAKTGFYNIIKTKLYTANVKITTLEAANAANAAVMAAFTAKITTLETANAANAVVITTANAKIHALNANIANLQMEKQSSDLKIRDLEHQINILTNANGNTALADALHTSGVLKASLNTEQNKNIILTQTVASNIKEINKLVNEVNTLKSTSTLVDQQLAQLKNTLDISNNKVISGNVKITALQDENTKQSKDFADKVMFVKDERKNNPSQNAQHIGLLDAISNKPKLSTPTTNNPSQNAQHMGLINAIRNKPKLSTPTNVTSSFVSKKPFLASLKERSLKLKSAIQRSLAPKPKVTLSLRDTLFSAIGNKDNKDKLKSPNVVKVYTKNTPEYLKYIKTNQLDSVIDKQIY
jgi:chromosome segregation ATPase